MISVVVPWRSQGCVHREAAWQVVQANWAGWDLFTADDGGDPFSRAASINLAVTEHPADTYVIADADILVSTSQVRVACELAACAPGLAVAFDRWAHLTREGTAEILDGFDGSWEPFIDATLSYSVSCCIVVSHETWERTGGFDPRFRAWGHEDMAFEIACRTLAGPTRKVPGTAWHLWHPVERCRPRQNIELLRVYEDAAGKPERLRVLR